MVARLKDGNICTVIMINKNRALIDRRDGGALGWVEIGDIEGLSSCMG